MNIINIIRIFLSFAIAMIVLNRMRAGKTNNKTDIAVTISLVALAFAVSPA